MDLSTDLAREQTSRLHRTLGRFDIIFLLTIPTNEIREFPSGDRPWIPSSDRI